MDKVIGQPEADSTPSLEELTDSLRGLDLDVRFARVFTHSGGFFNYCADEAEALQILNKIIKIEGLKSFYCWDEDLKNFLNVLNADYTEKLEPRNDVSFLTCEYLIAYDGKIVLSANNVKHYQANQLPKTVIVMANVSQIVPSLNEAMAKIKRAGLTKNLTSISGGQNRMDGPGIQQHKIFLLLLED